jgi:hypothetical protein
MEPMRNVVLISYIPLLMGEAGQTFDFSPAHTGKALVKFLDAHPNGSAEACIWLIKDGKPFPVFMIPHMNDVVDHLQAWSEDKPREWFDLKVSALENVYAIALAPDLERSIKRWRLAYQLRVGYPPPKDIDFNILFKPLHFVSKRGNTTFAKIKDQIGETLQVGFIDSKDVNRKDPSQIKEEDIRTLGPFTVNHGTDFSDYMKNLLENADS